MKAAIGLSLAWMLAAAAVSSELDMNAGDGWYTWRVAAADTAGNWCCTDWNRGKATSVACDLDGKRYGVTHSSDRELASGKMQIYARMKDGELRSLRALSASCEVRASSEIRDLGVVDTDASLDWLSRRLDAQPKRADDVMMAIIVHQGPRPVEMLFDIVTNRRSDIGLREHALFWLVQSDSDLAFEYLDGLLSSTE